MHFALDIEDETWLENEAEGAMREERGCKTGSGHGLGVGLIVGVAVMKLP